MDGSLPTVMLTGDNKIFIGNSNSGNNTFYGSINELTIYDRLLNDCEIKELYKHLVATVVARNGSIISPNDLIIQDKACNQIIYSKVSVYPNPPLGNFTIEFENVTNPN